MSLVQTWIQEFQDSRHFLVSYLRHPVNEIQNLPDWSWKRIIFIHILITAVTGALGGLVALSPFSLIVQSITMPLLTLIFTLVSCFFFYYAFQIFADKSVSFRRLFQVIFFALIPFFIFQIVSVYFSFLAMIGMAFTAFLLIVAFVHEFKIEKKLVMRLIAGLYVIFFLIWIWGRFDGSRIDKTWRKNPSEVAPEVRLGE